MKIMKIVIANQFKNEGKRIREWLEYYRDRGITDFVLVNDHSTDDSIEVIKSVSGVTVQIMESPHRNLKFSNSKDTEHYKGNVELAEIISTNFRKVHEFVLQKYGKEVLLGFFDIDEYIVGETKELAGIINTIASQNLLSSLCSFEIDSDMMDLNSNVPYIKQTTRSTSTSGRYKCTRRCTVKSFVNLNRKDSDLAFSVPMWNFGESIHACGIPSKRLGFAANGDPEYGHYVSQPINETDECLTDGRLLLVAPSKLKMLHYRSPSYDHTINKPLFDTDHVIL